MWYMLKVAANGSLHSTSRIMLALENKIMRTVKPLKIYINLFDSIIFNYNFYLKVDQQKVFA